MAVDRADFSAGESRDAARPFAGDPAALVSISSSSGTSLASRVATTSFPTAVRGMPFFLPRRSGYNSFGVGQPADAGGVIARLAEHKRGFSIYQPE